jgi:hypothetical protein
MSKVVIAGDASGTGTFTISAPNGNTDRTLVLPDEAGTVLTSVSDIDAAKLTGALPAISGADLTSLPASGLGVGQTWQNPSRSLSTTYYNTTGKPIGWNVTADGGSPSISMTIDGTQRAFTYIAASSNPFAFLIIQPGASYSATISGGSLRNWQELR